MATYKDQRENHQVHQVESIEGLKLQNNYVLCRKKYRNRDMRSKSGIWMFNDFYNKNQFLGNNVDRVFEIVKNPGRLTPVRWLTEIETLPGDEVYIKEMEAVNCPKLYEGDTEYYLLNYESIKTVKRGENIIPVNGHILFEDVIRTEKLNHFEKKYVDYPYGLARKIGKKLKGYANRTNSGKKYFEDLDSGIDIKEGDTIFSSFFAGGEAFTKRYLEYDLFARLDKKYWALQRRFIDAIIEKDD